MEINPNRKRAISVKNMIFFSRKRSGKNMAEKLAAEIMAAYKEAITQPVEHRHVFKKQTGGRGKFADLSLIHI